MMEINGPTLLMRKIRGFQFWKPALPPTHFSTLLNYFLQSEGGMCFWRQWRSIDCSVDLTVYDGDQVAGVLQRHKCPWASPLPRKGRWPVFVWMWLSIDLGQDQSGDLTVYHSSTVMMSQHWRGDITLTQRRVRLEGARRGRHTNTDWTHWTCRVNKRLCGGSKGGNKEKSGIKWQRYKSNNSRGDDSHYFWINDNR